MENPEEQPKKSQHPSTTHPGESDLFKMDAKTQTTIKWAAIAYAGASALDYIIGHIAANYFWSYYSYSLFGNWFMKGIIQEVIYGAIIGVVIGWFIAKFFHLIQQWNHKIFKGKLDTMFKVLFYPALIGYIVPFLMSATFGLSAYFGIVILGSLASSFIFAKVLSGKIANLYPSPAGNPPAEKKAA